MIKLSTLLAEENIGSYTKVGGQLGSNPGGVYQHNRTGGKIYAKFYRNDQQARTEAAAGRVYTDMGVHNLQPKLIRSKDGSTGVATKWKDTMHPTYGEYGNVDKHQLAKHFVAAVVTKNWDAIGLEHDNVMHDGNKLRNVDLGGSFHFRAQGGPKNFSKDIAEHDSLRDPHLPAGEAFGHLTHEHIKNAVRDTNLTYHRVLSHFQRHGVEGAEQHAATTISRLSALKDKYGV